MESILGAWNKQKMSRTQLWEFTCPPSTLRGSSLYPRLFVVNKNKKKKKKDRLRIRNRERYRKRIYKIFVDIKSEQVKQRIRKQERWQADLLIGMHARGRADAYLLFIFILVWYLLFLNCRSNRVKLCREWQLKWLLWC